MRLKVERLHFILWIKIHLKLILFNISGNETASFQSSCQMLQIFLNLHSLAFLPHRSLYIICICWPTVSETRHPLVQKGGGQKKTEWKIFQSLWRFVFDRRRHVQRPAGAEMERKRFRRGTQTAANTRCAFLDVLCCFPGTSSLSPEVNSRLCTITPTLPIPSQFLHVPLKSSWKLCILHQASATLTLTLTTPLWCSLWAAGTHLLNNSHTDLCTAAAFLWCPVDFRNPQIVSFDLLLCM